MAEPHTSATATGAGLVAASIAAAGPLIGPYLVIAIAAFGGAFVALTLTPPTSVGRALALLVRGVIVAVVATGLLAWGLSSALPGLSATDWLVPLAFGIGLQPEWAVRRLRALMGGQAAEESAGDR